VTDTTIVAVGDILLDPNPLDWKDPRLLQLVERLRSADLAIGNMECPLVDTGLPIRKIDIARADRSQAKQLQRMGFDLMTLANNHIMDYGVQGLKSTQRALRKVGIQFAGAGNGVKAAFRHVMVERNGRKIAFLGAHAYYHASWDHYPDEYRAELHEPGCAVVQGYQVRIPHPEHHCYTPAAAPSERFLTYLIEAVQKARAEADFVVLALHTHWGVDDILRVDSGRRIVAQEAVEAGADLIVGHGPHVFNGIEFYQGACVAHSLGNFFFHVPPGLGEMIPEVRPFINKMRKEDPYWEGLMLEACVSKSGRPPEVRLHPCHLSRDGTGIPHPARGKVAERIFERLRERSEPLGTKITFEDEVLVARPF
jgi:poly-gamma-glutamate capsule biosynthesis protein CapA/YwtB (metallophosphatase superfamily)